MEITRSSKLLDVLEAYPALEAQIVLIAPPFKNLKNPVLRRTVGKIATIEQVAQVGGMQPDRLVNTLRLAAGQEALAEDAGKPFHVEVPPEANDPDWTAGEPAETLDGSSMLKRGEVPLGRVNELLAGLAPGAFLLLVTDFEPAPILDAMAKQGRKVFHKAHPEQPGMHLTYIQ